MTTPRKPRPHEPETDRRKTEKENFTVTVDLSKVSGVRHDVDASTTITQTLTLIPLKLKCDAVNQLQEDWGASVRHLLGVEKLTSLTGLWWSCRQKTQLINSDRFSLLWSVYQPHACQSTHHAVHQSSAHSAHVILYTTSHSCFLLKKKVCVVCLISVSLDNRLSTGSVHSGFNDKAASTFMWKSRIVYYQWYHLNPEA